jgi:hypothetical protein
MKTRSFPVGSAVLAAALSAFSVGVLADDIKVNLAGSQEVPPVTTQAKGSGTVTINPDKTVKVNVTTTGIDATMAHIHIGPAGQNGPVIVPFEKSGDAWVAKAGAKLTDEQYAAYKAGNLYVNVHSAAHPGGEIRAQIEPPK